MLKRTRRTKFRNLHAHAPHTYTEVLRWKLGLATEAPDAPPKAALRARISTQVAAPKPTTEAPPKTKIRVTWIGHSTFLIQHQGVNILTDPIFGDCQPIPVRQLRRVTPPGIRFQDLPPIHHVLISHSHYDHLDLPTVRALGKGVQYWVPQGLSSWFRRRGITGCHELAWWQTEKLTEDLAVHSVPAQHGSARTPFDRDRTHWCGWVLKSADRSAYFAGDTGYAPLFQEIGERFGGFDVAMIPIGAYSPRWLMHPVHLNPADAVKVHQDVRSQLSVACHFGTFRLADEPFDQPPALLAHELEMAHIDPKKFLALPPGDSVEV
jgi:N-acyl-phosphatidylethanolamine-hydrolysing phospholipase D